tara:strand:+ start:43895 stop:44821 length:927 start_codon:yes stop_codon:yes gene_type:complete
MEYGIRKTEKVNCLRMSRLMPIFLIFLQSCTTLQYSNAVVADSQNLIVTPFVSLSCESCKGSDESEISGWELFSKDDSLFIESGHALLAHYTGALVEIEGDTVVSIAALNEAMSPTDDATYVSMRYLIDSTKKVDYYVDFKYLVLHSSYIKYTFPFENQPISATDEPVCLRWESPNPEMKSISYKLRVMDIFDSLLLEKVVLGNETQLPEAETGKKRSSELLVIELWEFGDKEKSATPLGIKFKDHGGLRSPCTAVAPIDHLKLAVGYERHRLMEQASEHYHLAAQPGGRKVYFDILETFLVRSKSQL